MEAGVSAGGSITRGTGRRGLIRQSSAAAISISNASGLTEIAEEIRNAGGKCYTYCCDIADREEIYRIAKVVQIEIGNVNILVNNAGYVYGRTFMELPDCEIERTFKVNILSHYWITKSFLKDMMKNNHGHIVTIASVTGLVGVYKCTDYSATKFAAIGYHESLFTELKVHGYDGIYMTLVCPYLINTGMFNGVKPSLFPIKMSWALMYHILKGPQIMMTFKGRESRKTSNNDNDSMTNYKHIASSKITQN